MVATKAYYLLFVYAVPFGAFGIIFLLITILHKRVNWFILHSILGIDWNDEKATNPANRPDNDKNTENTANEKEEKRTISTYLYINLGDDTQEDISSLPCIGRLLSDILASAILAVFVSIIFNSLVMSSETIQIGNKCPHYDAECFSTNGTFDVPSFNCSDGQYANISVDSKTVWCVGWVYKTINVNDVLGALGTCGGLLGIISSIVPFVYYLSFYRKCPWLSCGFFFLPLIPVGGLALVVWITVPEGPSQLSIVVFSVVIAMVSIGWCWALYRSCLGETYPTEYLEKCCCCCKETCCCPCIPKCYKICRSVLGTKYKYYPWCCFIHCCQKRCDLACCRNFVEVHTENGQSAGKHDSILLPAAPVTLDQPQRLMKPAPPRRIPLKTVPR